MLHKRQLHVLPCLLSLIFPHRLTHRQTHRGKHKHMPWVEVKKTALSVCALKGVDRHWMFYRNIHYRSKVLEHLLVQGFFLIFECLVKLHCTSRTSQNSTVVIMIKQFYFYFIRPEDSSPKIMIFAPMCSCKRQSGFFLWQFGSSGFFLDERPFRLCRYTTRFTVDIDTCVPVSTASSQGPLLLFWDWFALLAPK